MVNKKRQETLPKRAMIRDARVLGVMGSTRQNGATDLLLQQVLRGAEQEGAETDTIYAGVNTRVCPTLCNYQEQGCLNYQEQGCLLESELQAIRDKIAGSDAVVFASPVYGRQIVALLKSLSGKRCPHINHDVAVRHQIRKRSALLLSQGNADARRHSAYIKWMANLLSLVGFEAPEQIIVAAGVRKAGDVLNDASLLQSARDLGQQLAG